MTFSVVILSARAANLVPCVQAVQANEPALPLERIVVVDDGARSVAAPYLPAIRWVNGIAPFIYARNANLGMREAGTDVILLNDDARLLTPYGFTRLAEQVRSQPTIGVCSAGIQGIVGNPRQIASGRRQLCIEERALAFICVYVPKAVHDLVGPLDERFSGYGFEDNDYCARVLAAGFRLGVWDGCVVEHSGALPSTFRTRPNLRDLFRHNRTLFDAKYRGVTRVRNPAVIEPPTRTRQAGAAVLEPPSAPLSQPAATPTSDTPVDLNAVEPPAMRTEPAPREGEGPMLDDGCVDLMYLACNRLEFTHETFTTLLATTDWRYVHELFVYDDGSRDGTREWLESNAGQAPVPVRFVRTSFGSPVAAMSHFIAAARAPILAKTDNDAMLPPAWLRLSLEALVRHPELSLLGIEAMYPHNDDVAESRTYTPARFVSGLGLYRREAFARSRPVAYRKWFGLEEWQTAHGSRLVRGWITPSIPVFLLDRLPIEPWRSYSQYYIQRGWQRSWPPYDPLCTLWQWRWPGSASATPPSASEDSAIVTSTLATENSVTATPTLASEGRRFLCAMRVKNEGAYIREALSSALQLCAQAVVFDDHSTDDTVAICRSFGDRVTVFPSPFEGLDEARDKNYLLGKIVAVAPEWVLWIDGDEVLERSGPEQLRLAARNGRGVAAYSLRIAYVWDDPQQIRVDGIYGRFRRPSFFPLAGQPVNSLCFRESGHGGNFHCGNIPHGLAGVVRDLDVRLKHFGYMTRERRQQKYEWYTTIDPNNDSEDNYRHLIGIRGARHAPDPPQLVAWSE